MKFIAIDTGSSKTRVLMAEKKNKKSNVLNIYIEIILDPCNYKIHGISGVKKLIDEIISKYRIRKPDNYYIVAGFSGAAEKESKIKISKLFKSKGFIDKRVKIISDIELLLESISNDGIVLIAGTGCICSGRKPIKNSDKYSEASAGGYGYKFNSEPGGYSLGLKAIYKSVEIEDGISKTKSILPQEIKTHFKVERFRDLIPVIYESKDYQKEIAELSPIIFQCAYNKDLISLSLLKEHVETLASYIEAVYKKLGFDKTTVYLHGGLLKDRFAKELLIYPLINHKSLQTLKLNFKTLGVKKSDKDPILEIIKNLQQINLARTS